MNEISIIAEFNMGIHLNLFLVISKLYYACRVSCMYPSLGDFRSFKIYKRWLPNVNFLSQIVKLNYETDAGLSLYHKFLKGPDLSQYASQHLFGVESCGLVVSWLTNWLRGSARRGLPAGVYLRVSIRDFVFLGVCSITVDNKLFSISDTQFNLLD